MGVNLFAGGGLEDGDDSPLGAQGVEAADESLEGLEVNDAQALGVVLVKLGRVESFGLLHEMLGCLEPQGHVLFEGEFDGDLGVEEGFHASVVDEGGVGGQGVVLEKVGEAVQEDVSAGEVLEDHLVVVRVEALFHE